MVNLCKLTDRKRAAIIEAAVIEFQKNGFQNTSMDRIAATANVSKRTVYNHFSSKDELFAEILKQLWEQSMAQSDVPYKTDVPLDQQLKAILEAKMALITDEHHLALVRVALAEMINQPERARSIVEELSKNEEGIVFWIRDAINDNQLKTCDAHEAAQQLFGLIKSFAFWPQITMGQPIPDTKEQQCIIKSTIDMFLDRYAKR